jgi:hypothetical protein
LNTEPIDAGVSGSMLCTGRHEPSVTLATNSRTWGASERRAASTPAQLVGTGPLMTGPLSAGGAGKQSWVTLVVDSRGLIDGLYRLCGIRSISPCRFGHHKPHSHAPVRPRL